jgi:hypothetical protein
METKLTTFGLDGKRLGVDTYRLLLGCFPQGSGGDDSVLYRCVRFTVRKGEADPVTVPSLEGWSYLFTKSQSETESKGQVFGIDHSKFERLVDRKGKLLAPEANYLVYNSFIDFHAFCNAFAQPTSAGHGIQDLSRIGQKIVHASAFSEPPVNLGKGIKEGSVFRNGEVTLELEGLSVVDDSPCAMIRFDSGESSFKMIVQAMADMEVNTVGSSHYFGDIYIDLASQWVRKAVMREIVVSETTMPAPPYSIDRVILRESVISLVDKGRFDKE